MLSVIYYRLYKTLYYLTFVIFYLSSEERRETGLARRKALEEAYVICHLMYLISYLSVVGKKIDRAVQKASTLEAAANNGICYLSYNICYLSSVCYREEICYLSSDIRFCLLREGTDRAVQKANTLEAAANHGIYLSFICYMLLVSLERRQIICHLLSVICYLSS
jgi:hypothetical protein